MNPFVATRGFGTFVAPPPTPGPSVYLLTPTSGQPGDGVQIIGANFVNVTSVTFNGVGANFNVLYPSLIVTSVPLSATYGPLTVTTLQGSASLPFTPITPTQSYNPSYTASQIILAVQALLINGTGLSPSHVVIKHDANRVLDIQEQHCTIRLEGHNPLTYCGAGRMAFRVERNLTVYMFSRSYLDIAGFDTVALTSNPLIGPTSNPTLGHYGFEDLVINTLTIRPLLTNVTTGIDMLNEPMMFLPGASPAQTPSSDPGWYSTYGLWKLNYNQQLSLIPGLDGPIFGPSGLKV